MTQKKYLAIAFLLIAFFFQNCNNQQNIPSVELKGYWILKTIEGKEAGSLFKGALPTIEFNADEKKIEGTSGCNTYEGNYTLDKNVFSAPILEYSEVHCVDPNYETQFLELLKKESKLSVTDETITFSQNDQIVLEFIKGKTKEEDKSEKNEIE